MAENTENICTDYDNFSQLENENKPNSANISSVSYLNRDDSDNTYSIIN